MTVITQGTEHFASQEVIRPAAVLSECTPSSSSTRVHQCPPWLTSSVPVPRG
jgi:hypothetical protein